MRITRLPFPAGLTMRHTPVTSTLHAAAHRPPRILAPGTHKKPQLDMSQGIATAVCDLTPRLGNPSLTTLPAAAHLSSLPWHLWQSLRLLGLASAWC